MCEADSAKWARPWTLGGREWIQCFGNNVTDGNIHYRSKMLFVQ